jgi:uncharacterized membrane protein
MMDGWGWFWGASMMVVFWVLLAAVVVFVVRASSRSSRHDVDEPRDAQTILETRFAKGEISREEFEERTKVLRSGVS